MPKTKPTSRKRIPTGIPGLDPLIEGGFLENSTTLLTGGCGTGKTLTCLQFLYNGATKYNEPGVMVTFEETPEELVSAASKFGWDVQKLIDSKKLVIKYMEPFSIMHGKQQYFEDVASRLVKSIGAKRLVLDSTSVFAMFCIDAKDVREELYNITRLSNKLGVTTLLTSEILENSEGLSRFGVEEFVTDGVLLFQIAQAEGRPLKMQVRKMRETAHDRNLRRMVIDNKGVSVKG